MKNITLLSVLLASIGIAHAVPTAINYQGRLTDGDGNPASGSKLFSLSLYDSATAGNELYTETIGSIAVDDNGIYNFQFGANGTSTMAADEVIATTDGSSQVFNATLSELPVDGSVSIADGIYTWSQAGGFSAPSEFTGSVTVGTGAISAIYLSGAPSSGTDITASYDYSESGVSGALRTGSAHWIELSVDGDTQSPRERVLSVPFAQVAVTSISEPIDYRKVSLISGWHKTDYGKDDLNGPAIGVSMPFFHYSDGNSYQNDTVGWRKFFELYSAKTIESLEVEMFVTPSGNTARIGSPYAEVSLYRANQQGVTILCSFRTGENDTDETKYLHKFAEPLALDFENYDYYIDARILTGGQYKSGGGGINRAVFNLGF